MQIEKLAEQCILEIVKSIEQRSKKFVIGELITKNYNYEIEVTSGKDKLKVQVYFGKKGIKKIIQGNRATPLYKFIEPLVNDEPKFGFTKEDITEPESYIGSDESGKGDFFGPLVIAAVFVDKSMRAELLKTGVRDSKELTDIQISVIAQKIKKIVGNAFEIVAINPAKYNELYQKFANINELLAWGHSKTIENLAKKFNCTHVIIDQFTSKIERVNQKLIGKNLIITHTPKAERFLGVAAASILARDKFNAWFKYQQKGGHKFPKGASQAVEDFASRFVKENGTNLIKDFAKLNFKTFERIK